MQTTRGPSRPDHLLTALAPVIWGSTYIVASQVLPPGHPFTAALLRAAPAGLLLLLCVRRWPAAGSWGRLLVLSALNIGASRRCSSSRRTGCPAGSPRSRARYSRCS